MVDKKPEKIKFEYKILPSYNSYSVSGVHGGLNASGEVVANLFHERGRIPKTQEFNISEDGELILDNTTTNNSIIRNVLFSISMNPNTAMAIGKWLIDRANDHKKILDQQTKRQQK